MTAFLQKRESFVVRWPSPPHSCRVPPLSSTLLSISRKYRRNSWKEKENHEQEKLNQDESQRYSTSPEATSMMLVGCPRCLMYVMLAEEDPRCPKCKSTVLLDVIDDKNITTKKTKKG
ncbi:unnamed protein product [Fraxinus pennsylvanica]|uniref:GIR1-like zinc ribbon domain-containing protein n=1 Tax=Fraxinus pennsylvanica TaxID=56036 RepID=A0AAD2A2P4_9LAMI|nr:unnamed protein product [Fraxinus pennsylvanica]